MAEFITFEPTKLSFLPKSIVIVIALMYCLAGFSQSVRQTQRTRHYFFTHFTTTQGLVSFQINTTVQDEDGYIWLGTNDGLQRFDGVSKSNMLLLLKFPVSE